MPSAPHVVLRNVGKQFAGVQALTDVDLAIERGEIHALVGENGAGKSTLGKLVSGILEPDQGEIDVDGGSVSFRSPRDALAHGITTIAQEISLVPERSVVENVFLGIESHRSGVVTTRQLRARYRELAGSIGFDVPPDIIVRRLRLADQQKVEVMRAIARDARLIVMDEPTAALGYEDSARLLETVRHLKANGKTILYVSHFLEEVLSIADTVSVLRDGRVIRTNRAAGLTASDLITAMLGREMTATFPVKIPPKADAPIAVSVEGLSSASITNVSMAIRSGEIVCLAGLVGSGRSEIIRGIFGADRLTAGTVSLGDDVVTPQSPTAAVRAGIAMLPESRKAQGLLMQRRVGENVVLPHLRSASRRGLLTGAREREVVAPLLERLDVRGIRRRGAVSGLSGGNQQKALFAKWLLRKPRFLMVDEPTRGVDIGAKRSIYELLRSLAADGMPILMASSEIEEVLGLAHRILVVRGGQIVAELPGDVGEDMLMRAAFGAHTEPTREASPNL
jgi:simple sugar transport system ATP-binding protein/ribose transport system ATP-binding protein